MTTQKTITGTLPEGIDHGEVDSHSITHRDFEIGLPLMRHTGQALEMTVEKFGSTEGFEADTFYRIAVLALSLTRLGTIPLDELTPDFLYDALSEGDYDALKDAQTALRAKRKDGKTGSSDSASLSSPSESTD